jgi:hypothetical protein
MAAAVKRINLRMRIGYAIGDCKVPVIVLVFRENFQVALGARFDLVPRPRVGLANDPRDGVSEQLGQ